MEVKKKYLGLHDYRSPKKKMGLRCHESQPGEPLHREAWETILGSARMTNVKQPWAEAILRYNKNYENRAAALPEAGWVLILASKAVGRRDAFEAELETMRDKIRADRSTSDLCKSVYLTRLDDMELHDFPRGGVVGAAYVSGSLPPLVLDTSFAAPWRSLDRHAWWITKTIAFDDVVPLKGCQSTYRFYRTHKERRRVHEALLDRLERHHPGGSVAA